MGTVAVSALNAVSGVLGDNNRLGSQFDLLQASLAVFGRDNAVGGIDRADAQAIGNVLIDLVGRKRSVLVLEMAFLAANPPLGLLGSPALLGRGFDNVTGGRFGGVAGVFLGGG